MEPDKFIDTINYFGENNIIGFGFDNSAGMTFGDNEFKLSDYYIPSIESLVFVQYDLKGNKYYVIKHVGHIQSIIVKDVGTPNSEYDIINLRG